MSPNDELTERLLTEARAREQGRTLRRVLVLVAAAFVLVALGARSDTVLAYGAAAACLVVAGIVLWQAWKSRPPR